ncbi:hypothetical protein F511_17217 [Dorcoceras hygrometricum]|uniref:Uncharacterized protein n=1 Tax=Dorcoceras hygrometricum TaxID=472368 RepID=A0A2Z7B186_9LAMI|nr:hypothetical protein F511_17217 [Dorcoceras hygrometricum]
MKSIKEINRAKVTRSGRSLPRWTSKSDRRRVKLVKEKPAQSIEDKPAKDLSISAQLSHITSRTVVFFMIFKFSTTKSADACTN